MDLESNIDFIHPPLLDHLPSIRVLQILGKDIQSQMIHCTLETKALHSNVRFTAVSYTWGNPFSPEDQAREEDSMKWLETSFVIMCNDQPLFIRKNLFDFFTRMERNGSPVGHYFWIDAICINQKDIQERSSQVSLMGQIYQNAFQVLIWLGEFETDAKGFTMIVGALAPLIKNYVARHGWDKAAALYLNEPKISEELQAPSEIKEMSSLPFPSPVWWEQYATFCRRAWFSRTWIVQELVLAKNVLVMYGDINEEMNKIWEDMMIVDEFVSRNNIRLYMNKTRELSSHGTRPGYFSTILNRLREVFTVKQTASTLVRGDTQSTLHNVCGSLEDDERIYLAYLWYALASVRPFNASDPRDKVYGILGLVSRFNPQHGQASIIVAGYDRSVTEVYREVVILLLQKQETLSILSLKEDESLRKMTDLSSWIPDFSVYDENHAEPLCMALNGSAYNVFPMAKAMEMAPRQIQNTMLIVEGSYLDAITEPSPWWDDEDFNLEMIVNLTWLCLRIESPYPWTGQDRVDVLWRTLIADNDTRQSPALDQNGEDFYCFIFQTLTEAVGKYYLQDKDQNTLLHRTQGWFDRLRSVTKAPCGFPGLEDVIQAFRTGQARKSRSPNSRHYCDHSRKTIEGSDRFLQLAQFVKRRAWLTTKGYFGMGPRSMRKGDQIWIIKGAKVPFAMRPIPETDHFTLIGEVYVHGIMHGELTERKDAEALQWRRLVIK